MNLKLVVDNFKLWWTAKSVPYVNSLREISYHTPCSVAVNSRKEAARLAYIEGYKQALEDAPIQCIAFRRDEPCMCQSCKIDRFIDP